MHREEKEWRYAAARWAGKAVGGGPIPRRARDGDGDGDERTRDGGGRAWPRVGDGRANSQMSPT